HEGVGECRAGATGLVNDVWALSLDGTLGWTQILPTGGPPLGRLGTVGGYDAANSALYVFGGIGLDFSSELWKLSLSGTPTWSLVPASNDPGKRAYAAGGFDPVSHRFVIYGGLYVSYFESTWTTSTFSDVWEIDPAQLTPAWQNDTPDPAITPRWGAGGTISPGGDLYVVAGVTDRDQLLSEIWRLNIANPTAWQT